MSNLTQEARAEAETRMFGSTLGELKIGLERHLAKPFGDTPTSVAVSILSDCQELLETSTVAGNAQEYRESIRQRLNVVKWILTEYVELKGGRS